MPKFGDLEGAIMAEVWQADQGLLVREVLNRLDRGLAYNTVQTVAEILFRKGWLTKEREGRAYRYAAAATRDEYVAGLVGEALSLADNKTSALVGFVEAMDATEADELRRLLSAAQDEASRS